MNEKLKNLINTIHGKIESLPKEDYLLKFLDIYDLANTLYHKETEVFFNSIGLNKEFQSWTKQAKEMVSISDSFGISQDLKHVFIMKADEKLEFPIYDVKKFIKEELKIEENSPEFILTLSFMSKSVNFELFQISKAIILS
jgi:hypothetical protein